MFEEHYQLGKSQAQQQKWAEAISSYHKAIEDRPDCQEAYLEIGDIFRTQNNIEQAIIYYIQAVEINAKSGKPYTRLKRLIDHPYIRAEQIQQIYEIGIKLTQNFPHNKQLQSIIINSLSYLGDREKAICFCEKITYQNNLKLKPNFVKKNWDLENRREPNFIIIGFMKCGTTSLYDYMAQHPNILPASQKEIMFFNNEKLFSLGLSWYQSNFPPIPRNSGYITGEASTLYAFDSTFAQRVRERYPNIKLIAILRNPVDRAISHYHFDLNTRGLHQSLDKIVKSEIYKIQNMKDISQEINGRRGIVSAGLYVYFLKKWMCLFPREQILILTLEELATNTESVMDKVFSFLDVSSQEISKPTQRNSGQYKYEEDDVRSQLSGFFKPHNQKLEDVLNMKFDWS